MKKILSVILTLIIFCPVGVWGSVPYGVQIHENGNLIEVAGTVGAGVVQIVVLKRGLRFNQLPPGDLQQHIVYTDIKNVEENGAYAFSFALDAQSDSGLYEFKLGFDVAQPQENERVYHFSYMSAEDEGQLVERIWGSEEGSLLNLLEEYEYLLFGLYEQIKQRQDAFYRDFSLAKQGFEQALFDPSLTRAETMEDIRVVLQSAVLINALQNGQDAESCLEQYRVLMPGMFGEDYQHSKFMEMFSLLKNNTVFSDTREFYNTVKKSIALSLILDGSYSEREKAITTYGEYLGIDSSLIKNSGVSSVVIAKFVGNTKSDASGYVNGIEGRIKEIIAEQTKDVTTVGGGGSKSGMGKGALLLPQEQTSTAPVEDMTMPPIFSDLEIYAWAKPSIIELYERSIISGRGQGLFEPEGLITREEFVKMLVGCFDLSAVNTNVPYEDCEMAAWYYPYITIAHENRIAKGISEQQFGIGQNITRQDAAVLLHRALRNRQVNLPLEKDISFVDEAGIDDYAKEAVKILAIVGVITGFEDYTFRPNEPITRAQSAVIIDRTISSMEIGGE